MSSQGRRKFRRPFGELHYRKLFVIAVEGKKTEPEYFDIFNDRQSLIKVRCLKGSHDTSPPQVLKRMKKHLKDEHLKESDEAWLVVDKDQWTDEQLTLLYAWSITRSNYGFALSNPAFEFWLLLHFEDGSSICSTRDCIGRLRRYLPEYDKGIDARKINRDRINEAVARARARDNPQCIDWPRTPGCTTVYRLVENILKTLR